MGLISRVSSRTYRSLDFEERPSKKKNGPTLPFPRLPPLLPQTRRRHQLAKHGPLPKTHCHQKTQPMDHQRYSSSPTSTTIEQRWTPLPLDAKQVARIRLQTSGTEVLVHLFAPTFAVCFGFYFGL